MKIKRKVEIWIYYQKANKKIKILLLKTKRSRGFYWQPVTGSVEKKESLKNAALRESVEETGLKFTEKPRRIGFVFQYKDKRGDLIEEHVFSILIKSRKKKKPKIKIDPNEHVQSRWTSIPKAFLLLKYKSNKKALRVFEKSIRKSLAKS